jgi:hypothetical protein
MPVDDDPYAWTESGEGFVATVALVKGCSPARALEIIGDGRATPVASAQEIRDWVDEQEYPAYGTSIEAGVIGDWTFVVESGGYQAMSFIAQLSAGGEAVVIYQSVNADASFQYARNGAVIRSFDPLLFGWPQEGEPLPEEEGIAFPGEGDELHPMPGSFLLAERLTGIRLTEADLTEPGDRIAVGIHPD